MEYNTKFNIGDTVYSIYSPESGAMEIYRKLIKVDRGNIHVLYSTINREKKIKYTYFEDYLTKEKPKPKLKSLYDLECGDGPIYVLDTYGDCYKTVFDNGIVTEAVEQGNVFLAWEEAEKEAKRRKIHQELKKLAGGYEFRRGENNYCIYFSVFRNILEVFEFSNTYLVNIVYFETKERAQNAIKEIGEEVLLRDYFGIDEE